MINRADKGQPDWSDLPVETGLFQHEESFQRRNIWKQVRKSFLLYHPRPYSFWLDSETEEISRYESRRRIRDPVWAC